MTKADVTFRVNTPDPVAFITIDDGYATDDVATAFVQSYVQPSGALGLPVTQFLTYYAATQGAYPPPTSGAGFDNITELRKYQSGTAQQKRVGCHGKEHIDYRGVSDVQAQISAAADWLGGADMFNGRPVMYRPPNAYWDIPELTASFNAGLKHMVIYSAWINQTTMELDYDYSTPKLQPGAILCLHHPSAPGMDGYFKQQLDMALSAIAQADLVPAYLGDYLT